MSGLAPIGSWMAADEAPAFDAQTLLSAAQRVREPSFVVQEAGSGRVGVGFGGQEEGEDEAGHGSGSERRVSPRRGGRG